MKDRQASGHVATALRPSFTYPPRFWLGWGVAFGMVALLVGFATLPPFVGPRMRFLIMQGFSTVCHQIPSRSPHIDGVVLAVCHRCYGIYWGLPLAVMGFIALARWDKQIASRARLILPLSLAPLGIDWGLGFLDLWPNTPLSRLATGSIFGLVAGYFLARALVQAFSPPRPSSVSSRAEAQTASGEASEDLPGKA